MLTMAPTQACTPALNSSRSVRPNTSSGPSSSRDNPPAHSASTTGEMIAERGAVARVVACAVTTVKYASDMKKGRDRSRPSLRFGTTAAGRSIVPAAHAAPQGDVLVPDVLDRLAARAAVRGHHVRCTRSPERVDRSLQHIHLLGRHGHLPWRARLHDRGPQAADDEPVDPAPVEERRR